MTAPLAGHPVGDRPNVESARSDASLSSDRSAPSAAISDDAETDAGQPHDGRRRWATWRTVRLVLLGAYAAGYVWWFATRGIIINHVLVLSSLALFFAVASVGHPPRRWLRALGDFVLFAGMWLFYAESRGLADSVGFPIQVESVRNIDRFVFGGTDGVVWLQQHFLSPAGTVRWYDIVASMVYYSHFIVPPVTIGVLWLVNRHQWVRYMRRFATMLVVSCATFVVLPTAPPWMAGDPRFGYDVLPELRRTTGNGWRHIGLDAAVRAWDTGRDWANPVAAMPSLHSAFALFVVVFSFRWVSAWHWRALMLLYPATMAISLMYFGEHYLTDALAGWAIVGLSFFAWNRIERRLDVARAEPSAHKRVGPLDGAAVAGEPVRSPAQSNPA